MRQVSLALLAAVTIAASLAGAGFGGVGRAPARQVEPDGFGGRVAHAHVVPIWHEGRTPATRALHRVTCATAVLGDDSACYAASTSS